MTKQRDLSISASNSSLTDKATPVDADTVTILDSAASYVPKKLTWANLKARIIATFGSITQTGITMNTAKLLGRTTAGSGAVEEISVSGATLSGGTLTITPGFPAGTKMLFQQTAAPTGWTKDTTHNDKALRVVSGTPSTGGSVAFSTVFGRSATDGHTLTTAEMPSHSHVQTGRQLGSSPNSFPTANALVGQSVYDGGVVASADSTSAAGSGGSHSHNINLRVQYVDLIIASKDA